MSSTTVTGAGTTVSSRMPVQPTATPVAPVLPRSRTPSSGSRTPRPPSSNSSTPSTGRTLPVPGGGNVNRNSVNSNRVTPLKPLMESLPSNHRHGIAHRVCAVTLFYMFILFMVPVDLKKFTLSFSLSLMEINCNITN